MFRNGSYYRHVKRTVKSMASALSSGAHVPCVCVFSQSSGAQRYIIAIAYPHTPHTPHDHPVTAARAT